MRIGELGWSYILHILISDLDKSASSNSWLDRCGWATVPFWGWRTLEETLPVPGNRTPIV